jgi:3-hydroxybutyryl-CoA dehydrogenase
MGSGIAQVCAMAGFKVTVLEAEQRFLDKAFAAIEKSLAKLAEKGSLKDSPELVRSRLTGTLSQQELATSDIVIEAIIESVAEKKALFASLEKVVGPDTIFCTNTSSISVTEIAAATNRPERLVGLHFFNPVPLMKLVEIVRTIATADAVLNRVEQFSKRLGKVPVRTSDRAGFIVNRLLIPYLLDAICAFEEGVGEIEDIDFAMKLGCGYPMGPFILMDFIGLDTMYYISQVLFEEFKERRFAAPSILKRMVLAGWHGRKTGRGFYDYRDPNLPVAQDAFLRGVASLARSKAAS